MADYETVNLVRDGALATIELDRPEVMNAWNTQLGTDLRDAVETVAGDDSVRVVVIRGAGRAFSSGADLKEGFEPGPDGRPQVYRRLTEVYHPIITGIRRMPKPVVAAVNGVAAGAGASFAFACDFRVLAKGAVFNTAFAGIGLSCDSGASWWLPRLIGVARATELLMLARSVDAAEALRIGLATSVVPDDELPRAAAELAARLAAGPTLAYASIKAAVAYSQTHPLPQSLAHEGRLMGLTGASTDHRGAVEAFVAKRAATFIGS